MYNILIARDQIETKPKTNGSKRNFSLKKAKRWMNYKFDPYSLDKVSLFPMILKVRI